MSNNNLPWPERVTMLSINPDAATIDDIAKMASELTDIYLKKEIEKEQS